ncbi:MAG: WYL domain-containing protein, partial [Mycobacteriales bacterium]
SEPAFQACLAAVVEGRRLRFAYRAAGSAQDSARHVEPWGVVSWRGRWYLVGHDLTREAPRVFRLSRIVGDAVAEGPAGAVAVPEGQDLRALVARRAGDEHRTSATVRVRTGTCWELRRSAVSVTPGGGWDVVEVGYGDPERFADRVVGYAADAVVLAPEEARAAVVQRLRALAGQAA